MGPMGPGPWAHGAHGPMGPLGPWAHWAHGAPGPMGPMGPHGGFAFRPQVVRNPHVGHDDGRKNYEKMMKNCRKTGLNRRISIVGARSLQITCRNGHETSKNDEKRRKTTIFFYHFCWFQSAGSHISFVYVVAYGLKWSSILGQFQAVSARCSGAFLHPSFAPKTLRNRPPQNLVFFRPTA